MRGLQKLPKQSGLNLVPSIKIEKSLQHASSVIRLFFHLCVVKQDKNKLVLGFKVWEGIIISHCVPKPISHKTKSV